MIEQFANTHLLWLLLILPIMVAYYIYRHKNDNAAVTISSVQAIKKMKPGVKYYLRHVPFALNVLAVGLLIVALARPQNTERGSNTKTQGIDIVLALDVSSSMLARDFQPDRFTASKELAKDFILDRPNDRLGLVVFAGESFTQSPLTTDQATLINLLGSIETGMIEDGTAIGNGLATAVNRLKDSDAKSKVAILLTDGVNNSGQISPQTAAEIAQTFGIKVYTIGVGSNDVAPYPTIDPWGNIAFAQMKVEIDEEILREIAQKTGGEYFRATDNDKLKAIYDQINQMETTAIDKEDYTRFHEAFIPFVLAALALLLLQFFIRQVYLRQIP